MAVTNILVLALNDKYAKGLIQKLFVFCNFTTKYRWQKDSLITSHNGEKNTAQLGITFCIKDHSNSKHLDRAV